MRLLETHALNAFYGDFQAVFNIDFHIDQGETVAIVGANGAGKTTFLRALVGMLRCAKNMIIFDGQPIGGRAAHDVVRFGIAMVPEARKLFPSLTVEENLRIGGYVKRQGNWNLGRVYDLFPMLQERRDIPSNHLSGGQQQMAAIGRALMSNPRLLLCDELSLGLAPVVVRDIYQCLGEIAKEGTTLIIVEQDMAQALALANRFYCFQEGRVAMTGSARDHDRDAIIAAYFGV